MEILELKAQKRTEVGKNEVGRLRAGGLLPANLYGYQTEAASITVNSREFGGLMHSQSGTHVILKLLLESGKSPTVIVKEVQRHPFKDEILHIDFMSVRLDEKITSEVPISIIGDSVGVREGGILQHGLWEVQVEALPTDLPDHLDVDISNLGVGESIHVGEIALPPTLTMVSPADEVIASVLSPVVYKEEAEEEAAEEGVPAAVGEETPSEGSAEA